MKIICKLLLFIAFLISPVIASDIFHYPSNAKNVMQKLPNFQNVKCDFSQSKIIPNSQTVLKSRGEFMFDKSKGVVFYTTYPIRMTTNYSIGSNEKVNQIINDVINKNYSSLDKQFNLYFKNTSSWELVLVPKNSQMKKYLKTIYLKGQKNIQFIEIKNVDGTITTINFKVN